jgi:hypothetical protein
VFRIRVHAEAAKQLLSGLGAAVKGFPQNVSGETLDKMDSEIANVDKQRWLIAEKRWPRVTVATGLFSRVEFRRTREMKTLAQIYAWARTLLPLRDTQTLWYAVTSPGGKWRKVVVRGNSIFVEISLPYAGKHFGQAGQREIFQFGVVERSRLRLRVPPPPKAEDVGIPEGRGKTAKHFQERAYYRIKYTAERSYPRLWFIPRRSLDVFPVPLDVQEKIAGQILKDLRRQYLRRGGIASGVIQEFRHREIGRIESGRGGIEFED